VNTCSRPWEAPRWSSFGLGNGTPLNPRMPAAIPVIMLQSIIGVGVVGPRTVEISHMETKKRARPEMSPDSLESPDGPRSAPHSSSRARKQQRREFNSKQQRRRGRQTAPTNIQLGQKRAAEQLAEAARLHAVQTEANKVSAAAKHAKRNKAITNAATRRKENAKRNDALRVRCNPARGDTVHVT
jgi:hypothetical protein